MTAAARRAIAAGLLAIALLVTEPLAMEPPAGGMTAGDDASREVRAALRNYAAALVSGTPAQVAGFYLDDGELMVPGMAPLKGPAAILGFLEPIAKAVTVESATMDPETVDGRGDAAYAWGVYKQSAREGSGPARSYEGRFVAEWRRISPHVWRIRRLLVQPFPQPAPSKG